MNKCKICGFPTLNDYCHECNRKLSYEAERYSKFDLLQLIRYGDKKKNKYCARCGKVDTLDILCASCSNHHRDVRVQPEQGYSFIPLSIVGSFSQSHSKPTRRKCEEVCSLSFFGSNHAINDAGQVPLLVGRRRNDTRLQTAQDQQYKSKRDVFVSVPNVWQ